MKALVAIAILVAACDTYVYPPVASPPGQLAPSGPPPASLPALHLYSENAKTPDLLEAELHVDGTLDVRPSADSPALATIGAISPDGTFAARGSAPAATAIAQTRQTIAYDADSDRVVMSVHGRSLALRVDGATDATARQLAIDVFAIALASWTRDH